MTRGALERRRIGRERYSWLPSASISRSNLSVQPESRDAPSVLRLPLPGALKIAPRSLATLRLIA